MEIDFYLSQIERGKRSTTFKTLTKIAAVLGLNLTDILALTLDILDGRR